MMPIKLEPKENPIILKIDENELLEGYKETNMYHFMPEFLEKVYDGPNAEHLKEANKTLEHYKIIRNELKYVGSHIDKDGHGTYYIEYYNDEKSNLYVYLIDAPKQTKYYPSLQMVCVYERVDKNAVN